MCVKETICVSVHFCPTWNMSHLNYLLSDRFDKGLFRLPGLLNVLWCESGNHGSMNGPSLVIAPVEATSVEEARGLPWPACLSCS